MLSVQQSNDGTSVDHIRFNRARLTSHVSTFMVQTFTMIEGQFTDSREERKIAITRVAKDLFARLGFKRTTMEDIAQAAGLERASLYYYFKNKEEIFETAVRHEAEQHLEQNEKAIADACTAADRLRAVVEVTFDRSRERELLRLATKDLSDLAARIPAALSIVGELHLRFTKQVQFVLDSGVKSGEFRPMDTEAMARGMHSLLMGFAMNSLILGDLAGNWREKSQGIRDLVEAIIRGATA